MDANDVRDILRMFFTYTIETSERILPREWSGIHPPQWEHADDYATARVYAVAVARDFPDRLVRIVETDPTGKLADIHIPFNF